MKGRPSSAEWLDIKTELEWRYLDENNKLVDIQEYFANKGFVATQRQYKTRIKEWHFDCKKIPKEVWGAMHVVHEHQKNLGESIMFRVPLRGNGFLKDVDAEAIQRQIRRSPVRPLLTLESAQESLRENSIIWVPFVRKEDRERLSLIPQGLEWSAGGSDRSSFDSPIDFPRSHIDVVSEASPGALHERQVYGYHRPFSDTFDSRSTGDSLAGKTGGVRPIEANVQHLVPDDFDPALALSLLSLESSCDSLTKETIRNSIGADIYPSTQVPYRTKIYAAEWAAYYLLKSDPRVPPDTPRAQDAARQVALDAFRHLVEEKSAFVFPYCNWMLTAMCDNHDSNATIKEFLTDCCTILDSSSDYRFGRYATPFHFALALYTDDQNQLQLCIAQFKERHRLHGIIEGTGNSPNWLVNSCYLAWHELEQGNVEEALVITRGLTEQIQNVMGPHHTVTLNCLAIRARAEDHRGDAQTAIGLYQEVLNRLVNAPPVLHAYRDRILYRQALILRDMRMVGPAEQALRAIIDFRLRKFGIKSEYTGQAFDVLYSLLDAQGRRLEAANLSIARNEVLKKYQKLT